MALDYCDWQPSLQPPWLCQSQGAAWGQCWGFLKDAWAEGAKQAVSARCASTGAPDALEAQASDRRLERYPTETEAQHRVRLAQSFDRLQLLGTVQGLIDAVLAVPGVASVDYREAYDWDPDSPRWARWWLLVRVAWPKAPTWDDPAMTWDTGWQWDFNAGESGALLLRQVRRWKAAHTRGVLLLASPDAVVIDDVTRTDWGGWAWSGSVADLLIA